VWVPMRWVTSPCPARASRRSHGSDETAGGNRLWPGHRPAGTDRIFLEDPGCNRSFTADDIDYAVVGQSRLFHFGYPPLNAGPVDERRSGTAKLLGRVRESGVAISLDMTCRIGQPAGQADWQAILAAHAAARGHLCAQHRRTALHAGAEASMPASWRKRRAAT